MIAWRPVLAWAAVAAVASVMRFTGLADRPMHADEAVLADKFGSFLEGRGYRYDPADYHGPALFWTSLLPARVAGARDYAGLTETVLRVTPAIAGLALVLIPVLLVPGLPVRAAWFGAALTAVSPAMVYWSRDYIPEMLLALWIALLIALGYRYSRQPRVFTACIAGACAGLAWASKETAAIAFACLAAAVLLTRRSFKPLTFRHALAGGSTAIMVAALLFSPSALIDSLLSLRSYAQHAGGGLHHHPAAFYLGLLSSWQAEPAILALALWGAVNARTPFLRFVAAYGGLMLAVYSFLPYKTPWCLIQFWQPMILLAGLAIQVPAPASKRGQPQFPAFRIGCLTPTAVALRFSGAAFLVFTAYNAWTGSRALASDPHNPYVYAQTGPDVFTIRDRVLALASTYGPGFRLQVFSRENLWPLPWYLRTLKGVEWSRGVPENSPAAPVLLVSPYMEAATAHLLYEVPPPGERELYLALLDRYIELRPGVEIRGYVAKSLADRAR